MPRPAGSWSGPPPVTAPVRPKRGSGSPGRSGVSVGSAGTAGRSAPSGGPPARAICRVATSRRVATGGSAVDVVGGEERAEDRGASREGHEEHRGPLGRDALLPHPASQRQPGHVDRGHARDADVDLLQQREQLPGADAAGDGDGLELELAVGVDEGAGGRAERALLVRAALEAGPGVVEQDVGGVRSVGGRGNEEAGHDGQTDRGDQGPAHPWHCDQGYAPRRSLAGLPACGAQRRRGRTRTGMSSGTGRRGRDARTAAAAAPARPAAVSTQITWTAYPRAVVRGRRG